MSHSTCDRHPIVTERDRRSACPRWSGLSWEQEPRVAEIHFGDPMPSTIVMKEGAAHP